MFIGINQQLPRMFDIISKMMKPAILNYGVPNFTLKNVIVLFRSIIFLVDLCQLTTEFQSEEMQENIWPSIRSIENSKYKEESGRLNFAEFYQEHLIVNFSSDFRNFTKNRHPILSNFILKIAKFCQTFKNWLRF